MKQEAQVWFDLAEESQQDMESAWKNQRFRLAVFCAQQAVKLTYG